MNWTEKSPGIWVTDYEGFHITKIQGMKPKTTNKIDERGKRVEEYDYSYIAIKPGPPEPTRFAGSNIERIRQQIAETLQPALF